MPQLAQLSTDILGRYFLCYGARRIVNPIALNGDRLQVVPSQLRRHFAAIAQVQTSPGGRRDQGTLQVVASTRRGSHHYSRAVSTLGVTQFRLNTEPIPAYLGNGGYRGHEPREGNGHRAKRH